MALTGTIAPAEVDPNEDDEVRSGRASERDDNQIMLDGMVADLKAAWEAAGKPTLDVLRTKAGFKAATKKSVTVAAEDRATVKQNMIRRACTLHKVTPVFANDKKNEDGTVRIKWTVGPYTPRQRNTAETATETPDAGESAPAASEGEQDTAPSDDAVTPNGDDTPTGRRGGKWGGR
jgi:hypothetical protein